MKYILSLLVAFCLFACLDTNNVVDPDTASSQTLASSSTQTCTPGTTVQQDCNTCSCNEDGTLGACTLMACETSSSSINCRTANALSRPILGCSPIDPAQCTPGTSFQQDCNTCFCDENGYASCTEMACASSEEETSSSTEPASCEAQDVKSVAPQTLVACTEALVSKGWTYGKNGCEEFYLHNGCATCEGDDCDNLYKDRNACEFAQAHCPGSLLVID